MRYIHVPELEQSEAAVLPARFGKLYAPGGAVTLGPDVQVAARGVELVDLDGERLAIEPESVAWAFLDRHEAELLPALAAGQTVAWLRQQWPGDAPWRADDFAAALFRRGLVSLDDHLAVDRTIFRDSSNTSEGHLVELLLTEKCNLACGYCLAGANPRMPTMTPEIARRTVDLAYAMEEAPAYTFEFSGGEPFLQFRLMQELVDYIRAHPQRRGRPVHLTVQTNCTLLDEERVTWLKDQDVSVGVSLDGNPESHNVSRPQVNGRESFSRVLRGLDLLQGAGIPFGVLVVLNRANAGNAQDLIDFLVENGIYSLKLNPIAYLGTGRASWDSLGLQSDEVLAYFRDFAARVAGQRRLIREANLGTMCEFWVSKRRADRCMRSHCGAGETFQAISARGDIYPCGRATQSPALAFGNVMQESVSLSAPGRRHEIIQQIRARRPGDLEGCNTCPYRQLCQAGCSAQAFERYGTVRHRTPECGFFKRMYPALVRWLCFDPDALAHFSHCQYFGAPAELVVRERARA